MIGMKDEDQVRGMSRLVRLVLRFRAVTLLLFLAISGFLCLELSHIEMTEDLTDSMMPTRHGFLPALRAIESMSDQPESLIGILEVRKGDVYNPETVEKVTRITRRLMGTEEIIPRKILSLATGLNHYENTAEGLMGEPILGRTPPETPEDFEAVKRRVAVNPLGIGNAVSYDGTATTIVAGITNLDTKAELSYGRMAGEERAIVSLEQHKRREMERFHASLLERVRELKEEEEDENHILHFTGDRLLAAELTTMARSQVPVAAAAMMVLMVVFLLAYFRSFSGALVPVFAFALSVVWGLGLFGAGGFRLNPMAFLFPLLLGLLSVVCSALGMKEYQSASAEGETKIRAVVDAHRRGPVAVCVLTAGLVTLAMLVAGIPLVRELGWLGLFWLAGAFAVVGLVCPVLMTMLPRPARAGGGPDGGMCRALAERTMRFAGAVGRMGVSVLLALVLLAGCVSLWRLGVGDNVPGQSYVRSSHPWNQGLQVMAERFNGPYTLLVHVRAKEEGGLLNPEAINQMGDMSTYLRSKGGARESVAFDWVVKLGRISLMDGNPKWWTVPASQEDMEGLSRLLTFSGQLDVLVDQPFTQATIASMFPEKDQEHVDDYVSMIQAYIDTHPSEYVEFSLGGGLLGMTKVINDGTRDTYRKLLALALVTVFIMGMLVSRSVRMGLIIALAVAAGQALVLLVSAILGRPVSLAAVPSAAVSMAFGAAFGIYLVRQVADAEETAGAGGRSLASAMGRTGGCVLFLGVLAFVCMSPWFFVGMKFQADMAVALGIAVLLQAISSVTFIPALVGAFQAR
jgi:predicted RND superfamily exporter protein